MTTIDPFAASLEAAANLAAERAANARQAAEARKAETDRTKAAKAAITFGEGFLGAVARRVVTPSMDVHKIQRIKSHAEALLSVNDVPLQQLSKREEEQIKSIFAYGLVLAVEQGRPVKDNLLLGQRLITEEQAAKIAAAEAKPERIVIRPGAKPRGPRAVVAHTSTTPPPAIVSPNSEEAKAAKQARLDKKKAAKAA